jgi:hypothetical protein
MPILIGSLEVGVCVEVVGLFVVVVVALVTGLLVVVEEAVLVVLLVVVVWVTEVVEVELLVAEVVLLELQPERIRMTVKIIEIEMAAIRDILGILSSLFVDFSIHLTIPSNLVSRRIIRYNYVSLSQSVTINQLDQEFIHISHCSILECF